LMRDAPLADSATTIDLLGALLAWRVNGNDTMAQPGPLTSAAHRSNQLTDTIPLFVQAEDLPGRLRQQWEGSRIRIFADEPPDRRVAHEVRTSARCGRSGHSRPSRYRPSSGRTGAWRRNPRASLQAPRLICFGRRRAGRL
jgi:hypothetical protein